MTTRPVLSRIAVVVAVLSSILTFAMSQASAQEAPVPGFEQAPEGFTDGFPVGAEDPERGATGGPTSVESELPLGIDLGPLFDTFASDEAVTTTAASIKTRYFGDGAYGAIVNAASSINPSCSVSIHGRVALMLAPIFKESSNALTPSTAPSPMTLSRYDEWNGRRARTSNTSANYGLYAFRDPGTAYARAYWHPGIGIWQYDSAGVGSPFTASERMDTGTVGRDVARIALTRYCNAKKAGKSDKQARFDAWRDWGYPCNLCETAFLELSLHRKGNPSASSSGFQYLELVDGISQLGGTQRRTCSIHGGASVACWYVDPAKAQGANWWTGNPNDGKPTQAPAPLSHPFYVFKSGGREHRHWLREDTGYGIDISARRLLGTNARPRVGTASSPGLAWDRTSGLCDVTTGRGRCGKAIPPVASLKVRYTTANVTGYKMFVGDFDGNGLSDVFWYGPGSAADFIWWSNSAGQFPSTRVSVGGSYEPHVADVDGNGADDILWYDGASSYLWRGSSARGFSSTAVSIPANRTVFTADLSGNGAHDVLVYGPGAASDHVLRWRSGRLRSTATTVGGNYKPAVGNFDGRGGDDIIWYAPGSAIDVVWWNGPGGTTSSTVVVNGTYDPLVGDFDGDGVDDVVWYGVGTTPDYTWFGSTNRRFSSHHTSVGGAYRPLIADLANDGRDDIVWYAPSKATDYWWRFGTARRLYSSVVPISGSFIAASGTFGSGRDGIFWYGPGAEVDVLWYA